LLKKQLLDLYKLYFGLFEVAFAEVQNSKIIPKPWHVSNIDSSQLLSVRTDGNEQTSEASAATGRVLPMNETTIPSGY
jgi:hypothetical protein